VTKSVDNSAAIFATISTEPIVQMWRDFLSIMHEVKVAIEDSDRWLSVIYVGQSWSENDDEESISQQSEGIFDKKSCRIRND
jgi:ferric iron reductase protein FhuF